MKKKLLNTLLATAAASVMFTGVAQAATLDTVGGDINFLFSGYDSAQTTYTLDGAANTVCSGITVAAGIADCNTAAAFYTPGTGTTGEDTWGVAKISGITDSLDNPLWGAGDDGDFLVAYFQGFEDYLVEDTAAGVNTWSVGGSVDIYRVSDTSFYDTLVTGTPSDANRATFDAALGFESLYLSIDFVPGCSTSNVDATLCGQFTDDNFQGSSNGFAMATGGTALTKYPNLFFFEQSVKPCDLSAVGVQSTALSNPCKAAGDLWTIRVASGSALTTALPEPGALGLLGLGLVGMGLLGRRRKA